MRCAADGSKPLLPSHRNAALRAHSARPQSVHQSNPQPCRGCRACATASARWWSSWVHPRASSWVHPMMALTPMPQAPPILAPKEPLKAAPVGWPFCWMGLDIRTRPRVCSCSPPWSGAPGCRPPWPACQSPGPPPLHTSASAKDFRPYSKIGSEPMRARDLQSKCRVGADGGAAQQSKYRVRLRSGHNQKRLGLEATAPQAATAPQRRHSGSVLKDLARHGGWTWQSQVHGRTTNPAQHQRPQVGLAQPLSTVGTVKPLSIAAKQRRRQTAGKQRCRAGAQGDGEGGLQGQERSRAGAVRAAVRQWG
jgi:hypothetical protein